MNQSEQFKLANIYTAIEETDAPAAKTMALNKILVKIHGGIGDALIAISIIKKLSKEYEIDVILRDATKSPIGEWVEELLTNNPFVNIIHWHNFMSNLKSLRRYVKVILLAGHLLDQEIYYRDPIHRIDFMGNIAGVKDCKPGDIDIFLTTDENMWAKNKLEDYKNPVIIQPTTLRDPWPTNQGKQIPIDVYPKLFKDFPDVTFIGLGTLILDKTGQVDYGDMAMLDDAPNYVSMANKTTVRQAIALLKHSTSHIVPDSFLNHASGGLNKKGIVIFGNTSPQVYGYNNNYNLWYAPPCSPCRLQDPVDAAAQGDCCIKEGIPVDYENLKKNFTKLLTEVL